MSEAKQITATEIRARGLEKELSWTEDYQERIEIIMKYLKGEYTYPHAIDRKRVEILHNAAMEMILGPMIAAAERVMKKIKE